MKLEPISVFAINATVMLGSTPSCKKKFIIKLNNYSGEAVDRVQECNDFRFSNDGDTTLDYDKCIFDNGNTHITYSFWPKDNNGVYLITCRCPYLELDLDKEDSYKQIKIGMDKALKKLPS